MRTKKLSGLRILIAVAIAVAAMLYAPTVVMAQGRITSDNWTEMVSFKPDLTTVPITPGKTIGKWNMKEVAPLLPRGIKRMIQKYELRLKLREYEPIHPSQGYIEATNKYRGKAKIIDIGNNYRKRGLKGYVAGLPFPKPKNGLEVAWNFQYYYGGDDGDLYYDTIWVSASSGVEHTEHWRFAYLMRTIHRTDIEPIPAIKQFKDKGQQYASITYAIAPFDKKGFGAVYGRTVEPKDMQGHIYVPAMRRVLRNTFGTRGDTWNATDLLYEDVRGYMGYAEWMHWKLIGKKTILMPMHAGVPRTKDSNKIFELKKWPHWNPKQKWEPRPMYVIEVKPKLPDYPYSKMYAYIDAETFSMPYKEAYDKKGSLWKIILTSYNASPDMHSQPADPGCGMALDFQAEHATVFNYMKFTSNSGLDPNLFTLSSLRKRGR